MERKAAKEKIQEMEPSPFVLIEGGRERRIGIGESIALEPGRDSEHEPLESFSVKPTKNYLSLILNFSLSRLSSQWGTIKKGIGSEETEFTATLSNEAVRQEDDKTYIKGSATYFDKEKLRLSGDGWVIEYRPL